MITSGFRAILEFIASAVIYFPVLIPALFIATNTWPPFLKQLQMRLEIKR